MKKVFISSTSKDLVDYRAAAIDLCERFGLEVIAMEDFTAMPYGATEGSKRKLDEADLYIGIFAHRYGYIEKDHDKSVTEIEFDYAGERSLDRLCFLVDPAYDWPPEHIQTEYREQLAAFKKRVDTMLIRALFTDVEDFKQKLSQALDEWRGIPRFGSASAILAKDEDSIPGKTRRFRGRTTLIEQTQFALNNGDRVLLQGFGGMGKTALAAQCAATHLPVLWIKAGADSADAVFEALARPFNMQKEIASRQGEEKIALMRQILVGSGATLILIDDVWNGATLKTLLDAIPGKMKVLVTARERYPLDTILAVGELPENEALDVLSAYAGRDVKNDPDAADLCKFLGYHAFALEIAGSMMKVDNLTAKELRARIDAAPHQMKMPLDFAKEGRESIKQLLDASVDVLDGETRKVFLAMGAMFATRATPEMLSTYLNKLNNAPINVFKAGPFLTEQLKDYLKSRQRQDMTINTETITEDLKFLMKRGLAEYIPSTDESASFYRIHDLSHSYLMAQITSEQHYAALESCIVLSKLYTEPNKYNFKVLRPELDNFIGASAYALKSEQWASVVGLAWNLYGSSKFLDYQGYYIQAIILNEQAVHASDRQGSLYNRSIFLNYLGQCYANLGQVTRAIEYYEQSLKINHELGDKRGEAECLNNLGTAYYRINEYNKVISFFQKALTIIQTTKDKNLEGTVLGNLGNVYSDLSEYGKAIDYYKQALGIARDIGDKRGLGNRLANLGITYTHLGQFRDALDYLEEALKIYREIGDKRGEGACLGNLGDSLTGLQEYAKAISFYEQALNISRATGDKHNESNWLGGLGGVYKNLAQYVKATDYLVAALKLSRVIGNKYNEAANLGELGYLYTHLREYDKAIAHYRLALNTSHSIGNKANEANWLAGLGDIYMLMGEYDKALDNYEQGLNISREAANKYDEGQILNSIGVIYMYQKNYDAAIKFFEQARTLFTEIGLLDAVNGINRNIEFARRSKPSDET